MKYDDIIGRFLTIYVALFTRAWIEISGVSLATLADNVALFTRAWIEMENEISRLAEASGRPLHEGVD